MYDLTPGNFQQILKALTEAFEHLAIWYTHNTVNRWVIVTASRDRAFDLPGSEIDARFAETAVREDLAELDYTHPLDLLDNLLVSDGTLRALLDGVEPHHDDRPRTEFESGIGRWKSLNWRANMAWLVENRDSFAKSLPDPGAWPRELVDRYARASDLVVRGHLAYLNCQPDEAIDLFERGVAELPNHREPRAFKNLGGLAPPGCSPSGGGKRRS